MAAVLAVARAIRCRAPVPLRASFGGSLEELTSGCPPPAARPAPPPDTTRVAPKSTSTFPAAAVTAPDSAFDAASVTAALDVADKVDGASEPAVVASSTG